MSRSIRPLGWHGRAAVAASLALWLLPAWPQASAPAAKPTLTVNLVAPQQRRVAAAPAGQRQHRRLAGGGDRRGGRWIAAHRGAGQRRRASRRSKARCGVRSSRCPARAINVGFGGSSEKYILVLAGEDGDLLAAHARRVEQELRTLPGIGAVTSTSSLQRPELVVRPDSARAADLGVTAAAIADTLRIATAGDYDQGLAKLNLAQRQVPVVVRLPDSARAGLGADRAPGCARHARPGAARQRGHAGDRQRPGADRPLRPAAQHQLRDRAERRGARQGAGACPMRCRAWPTCRRA